ncbi:MAG: phytoene desaturase family protein [Anaerolineae bacterium]
MADQSVIIIGAGLAGLSAGCYAQINGYRSRIFEHHSAPGGVAASWKRNGYLIDGGIHFVMGHKPGSSLYQLYRELGIVPATSFVDMAAYGRFLDEASGCSLLVTGDLGRLAADMKAISPADARFVDELIAGAQALQGQDLSSMGMGQAPELMGLLDQFKEMWAMRRLWRYFVGKYNRSVAAYAEQMHNPRLRNCIKYLFTPEVPTWFVLMILALLADGQVGFIEGGSLAFVQAIERRYHSLGGQVTYKATVEEVLVKGNRAVGVRLADGSEHRAGAVISAADGYSTIFEMLGGRYVNERIKSRYTNWQIVRPMLMISYGVAREFPGEPSFTTLILKHPLSVGSSEVAGIFLRILNYSSRFAPAGKTVVQVEFDADWDYWNGLQQQDRAAYEAEKERIADAVLERLEGLYPGLSQQVEVADVATPYTTWRYTRNYKGAWGGWLLTGKLITACIERTLPGLRDFYMAGQWVTPGGSVPGSLYSGRHAVQLLCKRDGRRFGVGTG